MLRRLLSSISALTLAVSPAFAASQTPPGLNDPTNHVYTGSNTIGPSGSLTVQGAMIVTNLPACTPGSNIAPVPSGQAFQCQGFILVAQ